jgi:hypothetical protein
MEKERPGEKRSVTQPQVLVYLAEELVKNDVDYNRTCIRAIDSR